MFCKAKSAKIFFFCAAILEHIITKMFNSETTSFQHFSPRILNLYKFWTSDFGNIPHEKGHQTDTQTHRHTDRHMDIATTRSNRPSGPIRWKCTWWRTQTHRQTDMATLWLNRPSGADSVKILPVWSTILKPADKITNAETENGLLTKKSYYSAK